MKTIIACVVVLFACFGCAASQETRLATDPRDYTEAMDWMRVELQQIDQSQVGYNFKGAEPNAERLHAFARSLARHEPPRMGNNYETYEEYYLQTEDMTRATDRLLYLIQQRRREAAHDQLAEVARRYNLMTVTYGPSIEVTLLERDPEEFRGSRSISGELPGELRYNR